MQKPAFPRGAMVVALLCVVVMAAFAVGCGSTDEGSLSSDSAKAALQELPYRYEFKSVEVPKGASDAFAALVHGPHRTTVSIGVALGRDAHAVPVPPAGDFNAVGDSGFVFNTDLLIPVGEKTIQGKGIQTRVQWRTAISMISAMEEKLCREATGKPCPV